MRIATWNVNSIRARLEHLTGWLARACPDVVCVQETKVEDDKFPTAELEEAGYRAAIFGQKTYNGVAILTRFGLTAEDVRRNLPSDEPDAQRRLIAASVDGVRVVNVYVPNGQEVGSPAFAYKLAWLERLRAELPTFASLAEPLVVCGDFNVAPAPLDVHNPKKWEGSVLFHPDERARLEALCESGLVDSYRALHEGEKGAFTWWDYRMGAYKKNNGLRIDHMLATPALMKTVKSVVIDRAPRELERPSDHAPVIMECEP